MWCCFFEVFFFFLSFSHFHVKETFVEECDVEGTHGFIFGN
jgi:hypothetical protein